MQVHHLWEGLLWPRHTIKARWCKLFAAEMLCEKQGILFIEMHYTRVPFNTHMQKCGLGGLCLKRREQRGPNHPPKVWCSALPLASQVSMGHAVYLGMGTSSPYSSLLQAQQLPEGVAHHLFSGVFM